MELAEELAAKRCEFKLHWLKRDDNQQADDLMNEKFDSFEKEFRIPYYAVAYPRKADEKCRELLSGTES